MRAPTCCVIYNPDMIHTHTPKSTAARWKPTHFTTGARITAIVVITGSTLLLGCKPAADPATPGGPMESADSLTLTLTPAPRQVLPGETASTEIHRYKVRGTIAQLPDAAKGSPMMVRHEAIPDFYASKAHTGMMSMTMPFRLGKDLDTTHLRTDDKVLLTFDVTFDTENDRVKTFQVIRIQHLPADTSLNFTSPNTKPSEETPAHP